VVCHAHAIYRDLSLGSADAVLNRYNIAQWEYYKGDDLEWRLLCWGYWMGRAVRDVHTYRWVEADYSWVEGVGVEFTHKLYSSR
jgi:hypothetical protein